MERILWLVLGSVALVAAARAGHSRRALYVARGALGVLFIGGGAMVNAVYLATGDHYSNFADAAHLDFVRTTWQSLVAPNQLFFIGLLIVFEATAGALIISGGRRTQLGLVGVIGMHIGLLLFGWITTVWALVMLATFGLLLHAERRTEVDRTSTRPTASPRPLAKVH
jgi:uncharacterized membrane protein